MHVWKIHRLGAVSQIASVAFDLNTVRCAVLLPVDEARLVFTMYNGLFGDLPSAKKGPGASRDDATKDESSNEKKDQTAFAVGAGNAAASKRVDATAPPGNVKDTTAAPKPSTPLFVPRFMPQQMKRPRKKQGAATVTTKKTATATLSKQSTTKESTAPSQPAQQETLSKSIDSAAVNDPSTTSSSMVSGAVSSNRRDDAILIKENRMVAPLSETAVPVKNKPDAVDGNDEKLGDDKPREPPEPPSAATSAVLIIEEEPEYLRELHEQAKHDLYDPMVPNDLLHYWEHQRVAREKERLLHEREMALREHERMRQELDAERQRLQDEGDIDRIVQHRRQHQQGRKVSNIPAWLVAQQRAQQQRQDAAGSGGATMEDD
jgi:hypothetical protein